MIKRNRVSKFYLIKEIMPTSSLKGEGLLGLRVTTQFQISVLVDKGGFGRPQVSCKAAAPDEAFDWRGAPPDVVRAVAAPAENPLVVQDVEGWTPFINKLTNTNIQDVLSNLSVDSKFLDRSGVDPGIIGTFGQGVVKGALDKIVEVVNVAINTIAQKYSMPKEGSKARNELKSFVKNYAVATIWDVNPVAAVLDRQSFLGIPPTQTEAQFLNEKMTSRINENTTQRLLIGSLDGDRLPPLRILQITEIIKSHDWSKGQPDVNQADIKAISGRNVLIRSLTNDLGLDIILAYVEALLQSEVEGEQIIIPFDNVGVYSNKILEGISNLKALRSRQSQEKEALKKELKNSGVATNNLKSHQLSLQMAVEHKAQEDALFDNNVGLYIARKIDDQSSPAAAVRLAISSSINMDHELLKKTNKGAKRAEAMERNQKLRALRNKVWNLFLAHVNLVMVRDNLQGEPLDHYEALSRSFELSDAIKQFTFSEIPQ